MRRYVLCAVAVEGFHCWPGAPTGSLEYLRHRHRHIFEIRMKFQVKDNDREIEINRRQNEITRYLLGRYGNGDGACEFGGLGLGWLFTAEGRMQLIGIIIGQYLLKAGLALLDTPFFYFFTRNADKR